MGLAVDFLPAIILIDIDLSETFKLEMTHVDGANKSLSFVSSSMEKYN